MYNISEHASETMIFKLKNKIEVFLGNIVKLYRILGVNRLNIIVFMRVIFLCANVSRIQYRISLIR